MGEGEAPLLQAPQPDRTNPDDISPRARFRRAVEAIIEWARRRERDGKTPA